MIIILYYLFIIIYDEASRAEIRGSTASVRSTTCGPELRRGRSDAPSLNPQPPRTVACHPVHATIIHLV